MVFAPIKKIEKISSSAPVGKFDDDDTLLAKLVPKRIQCRLKNASGKLVAIPEDEPVTPKPAHVTLPQPHFTRSKKKEVEANLATTARSSK